MFFRWRERNFLTNQRKFLVKIFWSSFSDDQKAIKSDFEAVDSDVAIDVDEETFEEFQ